LKYHTQYQIFKCLFYDFFLAVFLITIKLDLPLCDGSITLIYPMTVLTVTVYSMTWLTVTLYLCYK